MLIHCPFVAEQIVLSSLVSSGTDRLVLPLQDGCQLVTRTTALLGVHSGATAYDVTEGVNGNCAGVGTFILASSVRHGVECPSI